MRIPIEALIEHERRREQEQSGFERPFLEAPRPMPMYRDENPATPTETTIDIGGDEEEHSDRGIVIISIWDD